MLFDDEFDEVDEGEDFDAPEALPASGATGAGLLPSRQMSEWLGDSGLERALLDMVKSGRMPHALVFAGPQGIGKATMAFRLGRYLLKSGKADEGQGGGLFGEALPAAAPESLAVPADDAVFRQVASGAHPDLLIVEPQFDEKKGRMKEGVAIDEVRKVTPFMRMKPALGGWRVVIVDDADTMNRNAQNAILKILEEPPERALLILVAHRPGALIPTIRSRCRTISFPVLTPAQFATLVKRDAPELMQGAVDTLYRISGGSIGLGLRLQEEGGLEAVDKVVDLLSDWPDWNWVKIHGFADALGRAAQDEPLKAFRDVLLWAVDSLTRAKARGLHAEGPLVPLQRLLDHYSLEGWVKICENLTTHFETAEFGNLDKRHAVFGAFSAFNVTEQKKYG